MKRLTTALSIVFTFLNLAAFTACDDSSSDKKKADPKYYIVSGTLTLPVSDTLSNGKYSICINSEEYDYNDWDSGNSLDYSFCILSGTYNDIDIMAYNNSGDILYSYHTNTAGLVVPNASLTGLDFDLEETTTYTVSGTLTLPDAVELKWGWYEMTFDGTSFGEGDGSWISGNSQSYSVELEPGTYSSIVIEVEDNNKLTRYRYSTDSLSLTVNNANITGIDFELEELPIYTISGTITLPDADTLTDGNYNIEFDGRSLYGYSKGDWVSGHTLVYSVDVEPGTYNEVEIEIENSSYDMVYIYHTDSLNLTVTDADVPNVNFTVSDYVAYTVSGTITLPGGDTLAGGFYDINFDGDGIASEWEDGNWVSGNTQTYSIELEPGTYTFVEIFVFENDYFFNLLYEYYTWTASVVVSDHDISGVDFTVEAAE